MELENLKIGEYYNFQWGYTGKTYIFKKGFNKAVSQYRQYFSKFYEPSLSSSLINCRLATPFEKYWLEECIKNNKYIPKNEIIYSEIYEIW